MASPLVFVAEDDLFLASLIKQILGDSGFRVESATNGEEALSMLGKMLPAVIVLDVSMPILGGIDVLKVLRSGDKHRDVPVLMLTGHRSEALVREALEAGATAYLSKPFQSTELIKRVRRLASRRDASSQTSVFLE